MPGFPQSWRSRKYELRRVRKSWRPSASKESARWWEGKRKTASEMTEVDMEAAEDSEANGTTTNEGVAEAVDVGVDAETFDQWSYADIYFNMEKGLY
jgi:hypothetical protein